LATTEHEEGREPVQEKGQVKGASGQSQTTSSANAIATVKYGKEIWAYIYTLLGFALTIETGLVAVITPLKWPFNLTTLVVVASATVYLFLNNKWVLKKLVGLKTKYEDKFR
jgi:hypothetical protein